MDKKLKRLFGRQARRVHFLIFPFLTTSSSSEQLMTFTSDTTKVTDGSWRWYSTRESVKIGTQFYSILAHLSIRVAIQGKLPPLLPDVYRMHVNTTYITMQKQTQSDIVWQVDESNFPRRSAVSNKRAALPSPRELTISIPTNTTTKKDYSGWKPPQEIIIGDPRGGGKKLPKTIELKASFCPPPPSVVVIVDHKHRDDDRIPDVIQVQQEMVPTPEPSTRKEGGRTTTSDDIIATEQAIPDLRTNQPRNENEDETKKAADDGRLEMPALADEITMIQHSESNTTTVAAVPTTRSHDSRSAGLVIERRASHDPPAAKAATTSNRIQLLPDFSTMAKQKRSNNVASRRRRNILDVNRSDDNIKANNGIGPQSASQMYTRHHQSWPPPVVQSPTNGGRRLHHLNGANNNYRNRRLPQWLGVTGGADDWIRATKPDDILQVGRKIADHRRAEF